MEDVARAGGQQRRRRHEALVLELQVVLHQVSAFAVGGIGGHVEVAGRVELRTSGCGVVLERGAESPKSSGGGKRNMRVGY